MRLFLLALAVPTLIAQTGQQFAELRDLKLESGETLATCRAGYRTFGTLNPERSNAVLFPTWFSGKSEDLATYIGPEKLVDTSRYYVVAVDALGNGVTCSPSNTKGAFPRITIGDMVSSEYRLLTEHLGIKRLHAVVGISMGGMQTFEWMVAYPGFMERAVPIIGSPKLTTADLLLWQAELAAIEAARKAGADPHSAMPAVFTMHQFALYTPQYQTERNPPETFPAMMAKIAGDAAKGMHPLDWAAQLRAMMDHDVSRRFGRDMAKAAAAVKTRGLVVVASQDHMVNPTPAMRFADRAGLRVLELKGNCGHMAVSCESATLVAAVTEALSGR